MRTHRRLKQIASCIYTVIAGLLALFFPYSVTHYTGDARFVMFGIYTGMFLTGGLVFIYLSNRYGKPHYWEDWVFGIGTAILGLLFLLVMWGYVPL